MTSEEWFAATDPAPLLAFVNPQPVLVGGAWQAPPLRPLIVYRRLRLFAVACARMMWDFLTTDARSAVSISERFADGNASETDLRAASVRLVVGPISFIQHARNAAGSASAGNYDNPRQPLEPIQLLLQPYHAARSAAYALATHATGPVPRRRPVSQKWHDAWNAAFATARATQAGYVRDIFPPPGFTPRLETDWLTSTVVAMARQMDESGDFSAAPILADALQDAGCDTDPVLQCCRAPGNVHVRGNWVVDLVLGRA
jgi:hypothetical protein